MDLYDPRDAEFMTILGQINHLGVVVLCALARMFPEPVKVSRLARLTKTGDIRKTLQPVLDACEMFGYATRTGAAPSESWHITDVGRSTLFSLLASTAASTAARLPSPAAQPALPFSIDPREPSDVLDEEAFLRERRKSPRGENLSPKEEEDLKSSSSSFRPPGEILSVADGADSPAQPAQQTAVLRWLEAQHINGPKRADVIDDLSISNWITVERLQAWLDDCARRAATGYKFRSSAVVYAVTCCLNHAEPPIPAPKIDPRVAPVQIQHDPHCAFCGGLGWYSLNVPRGDPHFGKLFPCEGEK